MRTSWTRWIMTACMPLLVACSVDVADPSEHSTGMISSADYGVPQLQDVSTLLIFAMERHWQSPAGPVETARASAVFSDGGKSVDVSLVTVNTQALTKQYDGYYTRSSAMQPTVDDPFINWMVIGDADGSLTRSYTMAKPLRIFDVEFLDTLELTDGITLRYTGRHRTGTVRATITENSPLTERYMISHTGLSDPQISTTADDDGVVTFSAEQLAALQGDRVYDIRLEHGTFDVSKVNGRWLGHYAKSSDCISVVLRR